MGKNAREMLLDQHGRAAETESRKEAVGQASKRGLVDIYRRNFENTKKCRPLPTLKAKKKKICVGHFPNFKPRK